MSRIGDHPDNPKILIQTNLRPEDFTIVLDGYM